MIKIFTSNIHAVCLSFCLTVEIKVGHQALEGKPDNYTSACHVANGSMYMYAFIKCQVPKAVNKKEQ